MTSSEPWEHLNLAAKFPYIEKPYHDVYMLRFGCFLVHLNIAAQALQMSSDSPASSTTHPRAAEASRAVEIQLGASSSEHEYRPK